MADYINRQTIIDTIHSALYPYFCGAEDGDILSEDEKLLLSVNKVICTAIKELPSADVVEIVRCKDCKCYEGGWYCSAWNNSPGFPMVTEEGYCHLAERRTYE